jgi:hypothetical protein
VVGAGYLVHEFGYKVNSRQNHHNKRQHDRKTGTQARVIGFLQDVSINRKEDIREDAGQNDIRHERQCEGNAEDRNGGEQNRKEDALLFQLILP